MLTKQFAKDAAERAVKTFGQTFLLLLTIGGHYGLSLSAVVAASGLAALYSVCSSVVSSKFGNPHTASLIR